jgi:branched-chain amino acid transport system ATP-binding protein
MEGRKVFEDLTTEENLRCGAHTRKDQKNVKGDYERVYNYFPRLRDRRKGLAGYLSGGEQQMLAIGRAIMSKPEMLLLDEPSMGLAPMVVEGIAEAITQLNKMGITVFLSEQNAQIALMITRHGYVLENGCLVLDGLSRDLIHNEKVKKAYLGT